MKTKERTVVAGLLAATAMNVFAGGKAEKPNIIFILCDDMGYGDLACYGQRYIQTPHIDRLAQEGMRFTQPGFMRPLKPAATGARPIWTGAAPPPWSRYTPGASRPAPRVCPN